MTPPTDAQWAAMSKVLQSMMQRSDTGAYYIILYRIACIGLHCIASHPIIVWIRFLRFFLLLSAAFSIFVSVSSSFNKEPFKNPVDWKSMGLFDYPALIQKPMDLGTVKRNINGRKYKSIPEAAGMLSFCRLDVVMIWNISVGYEEAAAAFSYLFLFSRRLVLYFVLLLPLLLLLFLVAILIDCLLVA